MKIYYSVQNGGDGSAYPWFFTTQELAEWDQDNMDEGWGESCVGSLTVNAATIVSESLTPIAVPIECPNAMDVVTYWLLRIEDEDWEAWGLRDKYLERFFSDGLPRFEVRIRDGGDYYDIYVDGVKKGDRFGYNHETAKSETTEAGRLALEERLNQ